PLAKGHAPCPGTFPFLLYLHVPRGAVRSDRRASAGGRWADRPREPYAPSLALSPDGGGQGTPMDRAQPRRPRRCGAARGAHRRRAASPRHHESLVAPERFTTGPTLTRTVQALRGCSSEPRTAVPPGPSGAFLPSCVGPRLRAWPESRPTGASRR